MSREQRFVCGTPEEHCTGATTKISKNWRGSSKVHASHEDAFACYKRYLIRVKGYTQGNNSRELVPPDGGCVLVLSKSSRFGGRMRRGKADRFMPEGGSGTVY